MVILLVLLTLVLLPASAHAQLPGEGFSSDNVEHVANVATGPTSGARLVEGYLYVTTGRDLQIYDTNANPEDPALVGSVSYPSPGPAEQRAPHEDPDTNGKVMIAAANGDLLVFDVRDKTTPTLLATVAGAGQHTVSCVLDCAFAWGSEGIIVDLRDPAAPKEVGNWHDLHTTESTHDVTEVAPGVVLTSTEPMKLLDLRKDPLRPELLAEATSPGRVHANVWPQRMADDFLLVGGEGSTTACPDGPDSTFMTFDTRGWQASKTFRLISEFRMTAGTFADGRAPATSFCVHWFDPHPSYSNGGLIAIGWYESGLRFLKVGTDGVLEEIGYHLPVGARTSAAYWRTDRLLYTADYYRGVDVLRFTGDIPQGRPVSPAPAPAQPPAGPPTPPKRAVSFDDLVALPSARRCVRGGRLSVRARRRSRDPVTSLRVRVNGRRGSRGRRSVRVRVPRRGRFSIQVQVRTRSGFETAGQRSYRACSRKSARS